MIKVSGLQLHLREKVLLSGISFSLNPGDYLVVVGPNGAGKSSLLKAILGMIDKNGGDILLQDRPLSAYSRRELARMVSYVPQSSGRELPFVVEDFLQMSRYAYHTALSEWQPDDQHSIENAMSLTNTGQFRQRQMATLSGGESQRVMIAAALAQQTPIMLLDEPTSYLDPHHQIEVQQVIARLNQQLGMTVIEVSHDINHAGQQGRQVLALAQGRTIWQGPGETFLERDRLFALYQQDFVFVSHPISGRTMALAEPL